MPCQRDSQSSCIDRSLRMASPGSPRELMSQHWPLTTCVQFQFDKSGVAGDAARGKIVGLDERHEPAYGERVYGVADHEPHTPAGESASSILGKDPPRQVGCAVTLQPRLT